MCRCCDCRGQAWQCCETWHREAAPMKGETALELVADYGCMHTHIDTYNDFAVAIQKNSSNIGHAPQEVS